MSSTTRCTSALRRLLLAFAAVAIAVACAQEDAHGIARDTRLERPLAELLALRVDSASLDDVDAAIQRTLALCRARGVSGIVRSAAAAPRSDSSASAERENENDDTEEKELPPADVEICHRVRFVRHARQRQRAREAAIRARETELLEAEALAALDAEQAPEHGNDAPRAETAVAPPVAVAVDVRRSDELDYQTFFETYAERHVPVVMTPTPSDRSVLGLQDGGEGDAAAFLSACFPSARDASVASLAVADAACAPWLDQWQVPFAVVNNFIVRTEVASAPMFLPALLTVAEVQPQRAVTCPFGLHTVLLPVAGAAVEYELHDPRFVAFAPPPDDDDAHPTLSEYTEVGVSVDATGAAMTTDERRSILADLVDATAIRDVLSVGHTLFVPGGKHVVSLAGGGASRVLRFCFVDASNLNHVTETLRVDALVSGVARRLFLAMLTPAFDASMARRPSVADALWANYMLWPKEAKKLVKRRDMVDSDHVPMSRRERLKLWQDDKRWERRVKSLTLPVPLPPVVMNATRHSVTLRWQDLYERPRNDITPYGYEVRWRREDVLEIPTPVAGTDEERANDGDEDAIVFSGAVNFTHAQLVRSAMPTVLFGEEFDGRDIEGVVPGLAPEATYSFTVRIFVGDTFGVESERSRSAQTAACSAPESVPGVVAPVTTAGTCFELRWLAPPDDGGRRVTSYLFAFKYLDNNARLAPLQVHCRAEQLDHHERLSVLHMPTTTSAAPTRPSRARWLSGSVCDQIPGRVVVRVAAVNAIGVSTWSNPSAPVVMGDDAPAREVPTVRGRGDPAFLHSPDSVLDVANVSSSSFSSSARPRVILSDVLQQVVVAAPNATTESRVEVWAGHHSPRRFHVSAELVLADPLDASRALENAAAVRDRVVVIARGGDVPFLFKLRHAQRAGALGVIFVDDVRDRCARGFDQSCVPGAAKRHGQGFGAADRHPLWRDARIPFVLARRAASAALLAQLRP